MVKRKSLLAADIAITVFIFFLFSVFRPDYVVIATYFLLIPYLLFTHRKNLLYHFALAFVVAFLWVLISDGRYEYGSGLLTVFDVSLFPLFAWATGLFVFYVIYIQFEYFKNNWGFLKQLFLFTVFYSILLIMIETIGYHVLDMQPVSSYPGLSICDCMHIPTWMKWGYFTMGPLFFTILHLLGLEESNMNKS